ncbi:hypothetical protein NQU59_10110 [Acinetobacter colistiniresistens]|uniref:hypothetical protein n=1 Tax=Acinetobacter colistiniresistens TaxID=280145 RepID=UPI00211CE491|nr:hypothetical protein [Acinetobacter colistiniresistens]UUM26088.1 hypothetical protein NQU59_10110 [Acinetobacter colistiniresistens]
MKKYFLYNPLVNKLQQGYSNFVQQKAVGLALVGYKLSIGAYSALSGFFMRNISMHSHISMAKLERDTFTCAGNLLSLSTNPFQLCHPHLVVNGKASLSLSIGVLTHV